MTTYDVDRLAGSTKGPKKSRYWLFAVLLLAPLEIGAKGCGSGVVGEDCAAGSTDPKCMEQGDDCGGLAGQKCESGEYCKYSSEDKCGAADATGVCTAIPTQCTLEYLPVCGCDGKTYGNACSAAAKGVSVASLGECTPSTGVCGGLQGLTCGAGEYCSFAPDGSCGAADRTGTCVKKPEACTDIYLPVCGCDGNTYASDCSAAMKGVSVASQGECTSNPADNACGGLKGLTCDAGEYCNYPADALCGKADATGVCTARPKACDAIYAPVCGCDGVTYPSDCEAAMKGVSVATNGECKPTPSDVACGARLGDTCSADQYCYFTPEAICGRADATGVCRPIPNGCSKELDPVCGCNGTTYGNPCMAAAAGVSVDHAGSCSTTSGSACGGLKGLSCGTGEYCDFPIGTNCGAADQTGTCSKIPEGCTLDYTPVCGCDGKTYGNACSAAALGMSVAKKGECTSK